MSRHRFQVTVYRRGVLVLENTHETRDSAQAEFDHWGQNPMNEVYLTGGSQRLDDTTRSRSDSYYGARTKRFTVSP